MSTFSNGYQRWLAAVPVKGYQVQCLTVSHPSFSSIRICDNSISIRARDENGNERRYEPAAFSIPPPNKQRDTNTAIAVVFSSNQKDLYRAFKKLSPKERLTPITVTHRTYMSTDLSQPAVLPAPVFEVSSAAPQGENFSVVLEAASLTKSRQGVYYELAKFPGLVNV